MRILAIETSCDDTAVAVLEIRRRQTSSDFKVLANVVSSQAIHQNYGGVFPMMAKREHQANLVPTLTRALMLAKLLNSKSETLSPKQIPNSKLKTIQKILDRESDLFARMVPFLQKYEKPDVDVIAVTNGPGLEPCLWVGVNFAKVLSYVWNIPVIAVNHIEGHIAVNFLGKINGNPKSEILNPKQIINPKSKISKRLFPAVALVVSGGHTQLILVKEIGEYKIIGETRDDAAGECFDKCAKILGLEYPGGPIIAILAEKVHGRRASIKLPRPMMNSKDFDFSFSGLKTAVLYKARDMQKSKFQSSQELWNLPKQFVQGMCVEVQQAIVDVLIHKTIQAAKDFKVKTVILGGGVSANQELRKQLKKKIRKEIPHLKYLIPNTKYSTDNALMIAITAWFHETKKIPWANLRAEANLRVA